MTESVSIPAEVRQLVTGFIHRQRKVQAWLAAGRVLGLVLAITLLACTLDRLIALPAWSRLALLLLTGSAAVMGLFGPLRNLLRAQFDWVDAAGEIERRDPGFNQRLVTVLSQSLTRPEYRGSSVILDQLATEVVESLPQHPAARLAPWRPVTQVWLLAAGLVLLAVGLGFWSWLDLPHLLVRFTQPWSAVAPVTTTRLAVQPGSTRLIAGQSLAVNVRAQRLGNSSLTLHVSNDGETWTARSMTGAIPDSGSATVAAVERDLRYYVTGGDATSPIYTVDVMRPPAVTDFRITYNYPAYTNRPPLTTGNMDGLIEAPVGTEATVIAHCTEPLAMAQVRVGKEAIPAAVITDPRSLRFVVQLKTDANYEMKLTAANGLIGTGPAGASIRAMPDHPPLVRLIEPADDLRLSPRDILPLQYEALDDYGLAALTVQVQVNASPIGERTIRLQGDLRHQVGTANIDLAPLNAVMGDVVSIWLVARDYAGQATLSDVRHVLVSPRSIDISTHQRIADLGAAVELAQMLKRQLEEATAGLDQLAGQGDQLSEAYLVASSRANRALAGASETATVLRQALLRVLVRSKSPAQAVTLADLVDSAQLCAAGAEIILGHRPQGANPDQQARARLNEPLEQGRRLSDWLTVLDHGERAMALLADRENLAASEKRPAPQDKQTLDRLRQTQQRMRSDITDDIKSLGLDPNSGDLNSRLAQMRDAADALAMAQQPVDFVGISRAWAEELHKPNTWPPTLERRLNAAAEAEAVRPDAFLLRARDLQLAASAAARLATDPTIWETFKAKAGYPAAMEALTREYLLHAHPTETHAPVEIAAIHTTAAEARKRLRQWAGEDEAMAAADSDALLPTNPDKPAEADKQALEANAAVEAGKYEKARKLDKQMAASQPSDPSLASRMMAENRAAQRSTDLAQQLDRLTAQQEQLRQNTLAAARQQVASASPPGQQSQPQPAAQPPAAQRPASEPPLTPLAEKLQSKIIDPKGEAIKDEDSDNPPSAKPPQPSSTDPSELAKQQQALAEQIGEAQRAQTDPSDAAAEGRREGTDPNYRDAEANAMIKAQEQMAAMPQALGRAQQAFSQKQQAQARSDAAQAAAQASPPAQAATARRAAAAARDEAMEAAHQTEQATAEVDPAGAEMMAGALSHFAPETDAVNQAINQQLLPALRSLKQAMAANDAAGTAHGTDQARQAIAAVQGELAKAQDSLAQSDPLTSAKMYARQAASALSNHPPDASQAVESQGKAVSALSRAWRQSVNQSSQQRMAQVPSLLSVFSLYPLKVQGQGAAAVMAGTTRTLPPTLREWGRLQALDPAAANAANREVDPPGYEQSLKIYFEALGKAGSEPGK